MTVNVAKKIGAIGGLLLMRNYTNRIFLIHQEMVMNVICFGNIILSPGKCQK
jgi:hypothetical protein